MVLLPLKIVQMHKLKFFFLIMCKMFKITTETFAKSCVHTIKVNETDNKSVLWIEMIDIQETSDVKNVPDLVDQKTKSKFKGNNPTNEQIKKCKKYGSEIIDSEKFVYTHEGVIISVIMHYRTTDSCKLKINFGFKLHDVSNFKEQTKLERIKDAFEGEMCKLNIVS